MCAAGADQDVNSGRWSESSTSLWCPLDPEFQYFVVRERLSAQLTQVRQGVPVPTSALRDGTARARRDRRVAARAHSTRSAGQKAAA